VLNRKLLLLMALFGCALVLMGAYNRPYRWWNVLLTPLNIEDMNEQIFIKAFEPDSLREPPLGSVSVNEWEPVPKKFDLLKPEWSAFKNPVPVDDGGVSIKKGKELYNVYCFPCHGPKMTPDPDEYPPVRAGHLPGEEEQRWDMPAADIRLVRNYSDEHIYAVITHGSAIMKRFDYHLDPEERGHVVNYIRSFIIEDQQK
jgi:mono/diheme cytochrome c family protein